MANINELPEKKLLAALGAKGLLGPIDTGEVSPLPALVQQLIQFRPGDVARDQRCIAVLVSGQNNQANAAEVDDKNFTIILCGVADPSDLLNVRLIAEQFQEVLTTQMSWGNGIVGLVNNGIAGPFYENDNRPVYEITGRVIINKICREVVVEPEDGLGVWGPLGIYF